MTDRFMLSYELHEHGWATAKISHGEHAATMTVSYLHDSLRELAVAVHNLSTGSSTTRVIFMDEPGEHQIIFQKSRDDELDYEVIWFNDWDSWGLKSLPGSEHLFKGKISLRRLKQQVNTVLWTLLEEHGESGYKERWCEHDFPTAEMKQIAGIKSDHAG